MSEKKIWIWRGTSYYYKSGRWVDNMGSKVAGVVRAALDSMYGEDVRGSSNYSTLDSDYVEYEYKYYGARKRSEDCMDYILPDTYY